MPQGFAIRRVPFGGMPAKSAQPVSLYLPPEFSGDWTHINALQPFVTLHIAQQVSDDCAPPGLKDRFGPRIETLGSTMKSAQ